MFRVIIAAVLMLSMAVVLTAQYGGISRVEFSRRHGELRAQAEQIKQETRFDGEIEMRPETNRITRFRGNFEGIRVPAIDDTLGFERAFDEILDRVLPHFPVNRRDLEKSKVNVTRVIRIVSVRYIQTANGISIEGSPGIGIYYNGEQDHFVFTNSLAYLDPAQLPTEPVITEEEAIRIYFENLDNVRVPEGYEDIAALILRTDEPPNFSLRYDRIEEEVNHQEYRLCWRSAANGRQFVIDAVTGRILSNRLVDIFF